ncbi:MAG: TIM-barrel domain-containing protein [Flavobacteriaceae bacterium]
MRNLAHIFLFLTVQIVFGQNPDRVFISYSYNSNQNNLDIKVSDGIYNITPYSDFIIQTTFIPEGQVHSPESHAVIMPPEDVEVSIENNDKALLLKTKGISVKITKSPFQIDYFYDESHLISEALGYQKNDSLEVIDFNIKPHEILYGAGARALGMNRRGYRLELYNRAHYGYETHSELMNYTMPLVISANKYMIHFDNAPIGFLDLDHQNTNHLKYETISGRKTYQIIAGKSWFDIMDHYTHLTGKQPMPPRWALGNFSSRFGYHSQKEVEQTIAKFQDSKIPVDAIILDLYWFGKTIKGTMGNLEVYRDSFPDFEGMISRLKSKGVKTIAITEPFILTTSKRWEEAVNKAVLAKDSLGNPFTYDFYFGHTGLIDIYNSKASKWFWSIYKDLHGKGVRGVWGDLGEPEVHPAQLKHFNATADEVHNIYGHDWAGLVFKGYQNDFPSERPFILMRAGYSGSQRYGLIPWSGDVNRTWGGLQSQPEITLQMGLQGLGYMHSDLGGFAGPNLDDELYVRWLQYGVFQPIFRPHAQEEVPSEPVYRSKKVEQLSKKAIELRYSMLPYNYHLVYENHTKGLPLMRPLFFEDNNEVFKTLSTAYLWGQDFLVSPITKPGQKAQKIHFPKSSNWFDFYSGKKYVGGTVESIATTDTHIPTFVRGGAIVPMVDPVQSTDFYKFDNFQIHYYYDKREPESTRTIYNDDGLSSNAIEQGVYELLQVTASHYPKKIELYFDSDTGQNFISSSKNMEVVIHNFPNPPKRIKFNNKTTNFKYDSVSKSLKIKAIWNTSKPSKLHIKL